MADIKGAKADASGQDKPTIFGGWEPVKPTDLTEIGKAAVDAYNDKHPHDQLVFVKVEMGWSQIVNGAQPQLYQAVVSQHAGEIKLASFEKLVYNATTSDWVHVDPTDSIVIDIAKFAVDAYNEKSPTQKLVFWKVEKGWCQIVSGIGYNLIIAAKIKEAAIPLHQPQPYQAVVFQPASAPKTLISFEQLVGPIA